VTGVTLLSRVAGFGREAVVAAVFGAGEAVDSYLVAQSVPNVVIALMATAVVTSTLPTLSARIAQGDRAGAQRTFNTMATLALAFVLVATAVMHVAAAWLVRALAPGFDPALQAATVELTRIVLLATLLVAATNLLTGLLHANGRLIWPAAEGLPFNAVVVAGALVAGEAFGVVALAWAFVIGSAARLGVQLLGLRGTGARLRPSLRVRDPGVRRAAGLLPTVVISHTIANVNNLIDRVVGSGLGPGSIAALGFGHRLVSLPQGLLTQSVLVVLYPSLSRRLTTGGADEAGSLLARGAATLTLVLVPIASLLAVDAPSVVDLVYARGSFGRDDVRLTAAAVRGFAAGLVFGAWRDVALRGLYALGDRRWPLVAAAIGAAVNAGGNLLLADPLGVTGLALATSLSQLAAASVAVVALRRSAAGSAPTATRSAVVLAAAAAAGGLVMAATAWVLPASTAPSALIARLAAVGSAGAAVMWAIVARCDRPTIQPVLALATGVVHRLRHRR
jgi:putative peptidoglycan lipid II flippase